MEPPLTSYDTVRYPSYTHPQTHPDRMTVIGALSGLNPAPVNQCRVLELGCGNGSNLVPMAWSLPGSQFVGVDLASQPIEKGVEMIRDLGLTNVRLICADLMSVDRTWGEFDYIIAHGVYSWVPKEAREQILEICRLALAPHGLAFISYNAYPGGHLRQMLGEMMRFHVRGFESADERIKQAMALARFLAEAHNRSDEYQLWLKAEWNAVLNHAEGHLYHDELSEVNQPFYFTQFIQAAEAHKLQFVAEADYFEIFDFGLRDTTRETLAQLGPNRILREQYLDFLKCRRFRQTILCHADRDLPRESDASRIGGWMVSSMASCAEGKCDLRPGVKQAYQTPKHAGCETDSSLGKACLSILVEIWPEPLPFEELLARSSQLLHQEGLAHETDGAAREQLRGFLLQLYCAGVVELRTAAPPAVWRVGPKPAASPVARWQIQRGSIVTTLLHIPVQVEDEVGRNLLQWLDGSLDRDGLLEKLWLLLKSKDALRVPDGDEAAARRQLQSELEANLSKLAKLGLLVA
ncbi:MAG TPA: class I SAM-dependent methyltransferase [Verrucomicrobiae bacterium]|jgi:SAM-dependent methyltransferase|nr:class I SAM-dependent methyltransferase [Verrucomicrobiae bacterium]